MVQVDGLPTIKDNAKVETRLRRHRLPPYIMDLIRKTPAWKRHDPDAYLIPETRYQIYYRWCRISREHGFEMTFHDLRHMSVRKPSVFMCPQCLVPAPGGLCPECGAAYPHGDGTFRCAECGSNVLPSELVCRRCGCRYVARRTNGYKPR